MIVLQIFARVMFVASMMVILSCEQYDESFDEHWEGDLLDARAGEESKRCAEAAEGKSSARLRCPAGKTITSIDFASYGLPTGTCSSGYRTRYCHSSSSKSKLEAYCLNKRSCQVSAKNSVFGDPCRGKRKRLKIIYSCSGEDDNGGGANETCGDGTCRDGEDCDSCPWDCGDCSNGSIYETDYEGGIIVPERRRLKLIIFEGGTSAADRNWDDSDNILWSMDLRNAKGVGSSEMKTYNNLWRGDNSINDVKRVIHKGKIHLAICGNGGDGVALYEFETKKCVYWGKTTAGGPHDVEYVPVGGGYLVVANATGNAVLEVYDISRNNSGRDSYVSHPGAHSVHWDYKQKLLWAWGSGQSGLKSYKLVVQNGKPLLKKQNEYKVTVPSFNVGMAHGGCPMLVNGKRYLILAGKSGILQFDTEAHTWKLLKRAPGSAGLYSNPKGLSYHRETGGIILTKSKDSVWSLKNGVGARQLNNAEFYKARWWYHTTFSHP